MRYFAVRLLPFVFASLLAAQDQNTLSHIADIRRLPYETLAEAKSVRVQGVVTWHSTPSLWGFIVDDGDEGIYCDVRLALQRGVLPPDHDLTSLIADGALVKMEGVTDPGNYAPVILPQRVSVQGTAPLPEPDSVTFPSLFSGALDSQRVSMSGVVHASSSLEGSSSLRLDVGTIHGSFQILIMEPVTFALASLVDAQVRVKGCVLPLFNARAELVGVSVQTNRMSDLEIVRPAPADPFVVPEMSRSALRPFSLMGVTLHRQKVRGVVTAQRPGTCLFIQRGQLGIQAFSESREPFQPGDVVEAAGFVNFRSAVGCLENALFRKVGTAPIPEPRSVTVARLMESGGDAARDPDVEDLDAALIRIQGTVAAVEQREREARITLVSDGRFLPATLVTEPHDRPFSALAPGAVVSVTGVVTLTYKVGVPTSSLLQPSGALVMMRSLADLMLIRPAPWWTPQRINWALGLAAALALALFIWIIALNRLVIRQSTGLFLKTRALRDAELEQQAIRLERNRLAGELHDGLQQLIAATFIQVQNAKAHLDAEDPLKLRHHLDLAGHGLEITQQELRQCLWGLRELADAPMASLPTSLQVALSPFQNWSKTSIELIASGMDGVHLPRHLIAGLLLVVQEAVGNALKHGKASRIRVHVAWTQEGLDLTIEDNGCGFDLEAKTAEMGRFGLNGMSARMRRLGGTLQITSMTSRGTLVRAHLSSTAIREETTATLRPPTSSLS